MVNYNRVILKNSLNFISIYREVQSFCFSILIEFICVLHHFNVIFFKYAHILSSFNELRFFGPFFDIPMKKGLLFKYFIELVIKAVKDFLDGCTIRNGENLPG